MRAGDVLVGVSTADAPGVAPAMRRAGAWGLTSVWIGAGLRPPPGAADHVLWVDDPGRDGCFDGRLVLRYHLLWELTHVCFEHPGLLTPTADLRAGRGLRHLLRRGTAGRGRRGAASPMSRRSARPTGRSVIDTTIVGPVHPGDLVLVHAGAAIDVIEEVGPDA